MNCGDEMGLALSRYVDGESGPEERTHVEEHCASCEDCRTLLELFTRNDRVLNDAIGNQAFGNRVLDGVLQKLDAETVSAEPARRIEWPRWATPVAAAAAVLVIALAGMLALWRAGMSDLQKQLAENEDAFLAIYNSVSMENDRNRDERQDLLNLANWLVADEVNKRMQQETPPAGIWTSGPRAIRLRANFADAGQYDSFSVRRRTEGDRDWETAAKGLLEPVYVDKDAAPGEIYWYIFTAVREDGSTVDSKPQRAVLQAPGGGDPRSGVRIECRDANLERDIARFRVSRYIDDNPFYWDFVVRVGEEIGGKEFIPGKGEVDLSTGMTLQRLEKGVQTIILQLVYPETDEEGNPVVWPDGTPVTRNEPKVIAVRPNVKALLHRADDDLPVTVWKSQEVVIPEE
ncbi:MAG: anti-sigma factor family protein [Planctomycetota bacterium]|jgi:hypothetical protein